MITSEIVVRRPAAQNVPPGVALPAGPAGQPGKDGGPGPIGPPGPAQDISGKLDKTGDASGATAAGLFPLSRTFTSRLADAVSVKDFGAIGDGATHPLSSKFSTLAAAQLVYACALALSDEIDWCAFQTAVNSGRPVWIPDGYYLVNRTIAVTLNGVLLEGCHRDATQIRRHGDFGPTIKFSNNSYIYNTGLKNIAFYDFGGAPGLGPAMTQANSPYAIIFDSHKNTRIENLSVGLGPNSGSAGGGISMLGSVEFYLRDVYITLDAGPSSGRHAFRLGVSQIAGAPSPGGAGKSAINALNVEGSTFNYTNGVLTSINSHIDDGIRIESGDGLWISDTHVQGTTLSDLHFATTAGVQLSNIHIANTMLDITNGSACRIDGTGVVDRIDMQARLSAAGVGNAGSQAGFLATAAVTEGSFVLGIQGFSGVGLSFTSSATKTVTFFISQVKKCLGGGLQFAAGTDISVVGGTIGADGVTPYGIQVGAGVNGFTASGVSCVGTAPSPSGYGYILQSGATGIGINGGRATGNASGAVIDNTASTAKVRVSGVLGQADITKN
ncbi:hypothetical protein [Methylobacterium brachiatum]|uniref:hypothetical protein n=1 Tax=Methylobacterium brachiatum TaxID=269660 RepID=UPI0008E2FB7E|nr:hypothetical protein [Methylobacterium brachiatum]SFJ67616.1 hypothetical protein SAMN02799642_05131 [Methylobacterium brachiatum]